VVLSHHLPVVAEENREKPQSASPVARPKFEPHIYEYRYMPRVLPRAKFTAVIIK
jgi:hypothetical protein